MQEGNDEGCRFFRSISTLGEKVAQIGVILYMFLVGLELEPSRLWALRQPVFGLGGAQVLATGLALAAIAHWLGYGWQAATVIGFGLAMSSTAIVLAWLGERGELSSPSGRRAFAILLFQDLAVPLKPGQPIPEIRDRGL